MNLLKLATLIIVIVAANAHSNEEWQQSWSAKVGSGESNNHDDEHHNLFHIIAGLQATIRRLEVRLTEIERKYCFCPPREPTTNAHDCRQLYNLGYTQDGVYTLTVNGSSVQVFCEDRGWTVLQKRSDDSVDYDRDMADYEEGFGDITGEHWLGLNTVHQMTTSSNQTRGNWTLRFDFEDWDGETRWVEYSEFQVTASPDYKLLFDTTSYRGTAGETGISFHGFSYHYGVKFTTRDLAQDDMRMGSNNCATGYKGGFWYCGLDGYCALVTTTGMPYGAEGAIIWLPWKGFTTLKSATIRMIKQDI